MAEYPIDLGKKMGENPMEATVSKRDKNEKYYPSLYLTWDSKYGLPDSGEMTVKFRKNSETTRKDRDGEESQDVSIDILSIESVEAGEDVSPEEDRGEVLDKMAKKGKYSEDEED
jgi:hypothetical protein